MRNWISTLLALVVLLQIGVSSADAADGYWERAPRKLPKGTKKRVNLGANSYREWAIRERKLSGVDVQTALDGSLLGNSGNKTTVFRWWATWSLPPRRVEAGAPIRLKCEVGATLVRGGARPTFSLAAWLEGAGKQRKGSQKTLGVDTRRRMRGQGTLAPRAPRGRRAGEVFNLVINGSFSAFGVAELPIVYPYRWVEAEAKPELKVRAQVEDRDDQLTPADQATIVLSLANVAKEVDAENLRVEVWFDKASAQLGGKKGSIPSYWDHLRVTPALRFDRPNMGQRIDRKSVHIAAASEKEMRLGFHVEDEDNYWILRVLLQGGGNGKLDERRKPSREASYALKGALRVRVRMGEDVLFHDAIDIRRGKQVATVQYPDFRAVAGQPTDRENLPYYLYGDPGRSPSGHVAVRAIALRAARYGESGGFVPENDPVRVISNVAQYVHDSFKPKVYPESIGGVIEVAAELYHHDYGPQVGRYPRSEGEKTGFPCIEHAFMLNSLCRALGYPARGVNALTWASVPYIGASFQDASSQIWCRGRWHYRSLFTYGAGVVTNPHTRYGKWLRTFEIWVGTGTYWGEHTRFEMGGREMRESPLWKFWGYGNVKHFVTADERPLTASLGVGLGPWVAFNFYSPVVASMKRADGTRVGPTASAPLTAEVRNWYVLGGDPPKGAIPAGPMGVWYPEGLPAYTEGADGEWKLRPMPQTLVVPVTGPLEKMVGEIELTGTGDGPWRMEALYVDEKGVQSYKGRSGTVTKGERIVIKTRDLEPAGARQTWQTINAPREPPEPEPSFGVRMVMVDALTARAFGAPEGRVAVVVVVEGSAAHAAGVQWLDVLDQAGDVPIRTMKDLVDFTGAHAVGDRVRLRVLRGGKSKELLVTLGRRDFRLSRDEIRQDCTFVTSTDDFVDAFRHDVLLGSRVTALGWNGREWLAVRTRVWGLDLQTWRFARDAETLRTVLKEGEASGFRVTCLSYAAGRASVVMSRTHDWKEQRLLVEPGYKELRAAIKRAWKEDFRVTGLVHTGTEWWAVVAKGTPIRSQSYLSYKGWKKFDDGIRRSWEAGRHVRHIARNGEQWFGIASRAPVGRNQHIVVAATPETVNERLSEAWELGWRIGFVFWDGTNWLIGID